MNGSPISEAIRERDSEGGQLGLALQELEAGFGAELEQLEVAAAATAAGRPAPVAQVLDLATLEAEQTLRLDDFEHPVTAYLNSLASSSRRPQLSALGWIARRATQLYTAETMPWHQLRRPHVLRIRGLLEEHYQAATANRMLAALRGVLKECWQAQLLSIEDYQSAISIPAVRGESEPRGRHLSASELRSLFEACSDPSSQGQRQAATARRRRDAAFLALAYSCGLRRSEAVAVDLADLDLVSGELRVCRGKGRKPRQLTLPPSALPALRDWLNVRGTEPGPLFCPVLKSGRLLMEGDQLARLSPGGVWRICRERGLQAQIQVPAPHDLRRTWIGDLLDLGVDLAAVQKMAGHASASTTGRYDRRDRAVQRRAAAILNVPFGLSQPELNCSRPSKTELKSGLSTSDQILVSLLSDL
jgi:integrase